MTEETTTRTFPVDLTEEEKIELGGKIAELNIEIEEMMEEKKALPKRIEGKQEIAASLSHKLKDGKKDVEVKCTWISNDPEEGQKTLYREDTSETVETVPMDLFDDMKEGTVEITPAEEQPSEVEAGEKNK